ncbi:MAG: flagellar protein FliT [Methyloprofundus sp.]|nr:flagellar protein FliT [Methyloprofundus sp.]MBW6453125.1 flagellar protein FliT [Methyloprofundus sp.]
MSDLFSQFFQYPEKIKNLVAAQDWASLSEILAERQSGLEQLVPAMKAEGKNSELKELILKIQQQDAAFLELIGEKRQLTEAKFLSLKQGRKSIKAYQP